MGLFDFLKRKPVDQSIIDDITVSVSSPVSGQVVAIKEVPDPVFSEGMMGEGVAIMPHEGVLRAPFHGKVTSLYPTGHAIGLTSDEGVELLIHIGLDTVSLEGKGYTTHVALEQPIQEGQQLITFDPVFIKEAGYHLITPIIVANGEIFKQVSVYADGEITSGELLMEVAK